MAGMWMPVHFAMACSRKATIGCWPVPAKARRQSVFLRGANAAIAAQTASATLWSAQMNALVKRLGELRMGKDEGGVWTRAISKRFDVSEHSSRAYTQDISGVEVGADKAFAVNAGKVYVGAMVGAARSDQDFGEGASGTTDSKMFGVYATYLNDNGIYVDSVLKYSRFDNDIKMPTNLGQSVKGSYTTNGVGADIEVGKHIKLGDGWFVEPQLELTATRTQGANYTASNGLKVNADDMDSLQSRVGSLFGRSLALSNGMKAQPYVKASYITEHAGSTKVSVNGNKLDAELPGNRVELGFGGVLQVSEKSKISLDAEYAKGNSIEQPWGVNLGYRYLW
ncbi:autotransporter outer membrane beta-barrel domain-containing protein [Pseudomonas poae]|nr:autotransporter outer membrane beta-barrel domain-containing protein [Pseudomonas poae]